MRSAAGTIAAALAVIAWTTGCGDRTAPVWEDGAALAAVDVTADHVALQWPAATDGEGVVGYEMTRGGSTPEALGNARSWSIRDLAELTEYHFAVVALDEAGNRSEPLETSVQTLDGTPPMWPEDCAELAAEPVAEHDLDQGVRFTWCEASDNVGVTVYRLSRGARSGRYGIGEGAAVSVELEPGVREHVHAERPLDGSWRLEACDEVGLCSSQARAVTLEAAERRAAMDREIAQSAGVLAALLSDSSWSSESLFGTDMLEVSAFDDMGIGGLIGSAMGESSGSGGLGSRGSGLGGGGTAEGLGGLGTRGAGGGGRGYGSGGGIARVGGGGSWRSPSASLASGSPDPLRAHGQRRADRVDYCYQQAHRRDDSIAGSLTVSLTADAAGAVTVGGVQGNGDAELVRCVTSTLGGHLPEAPDAPLAGTVTFTLDPGGRD